MFKYQNPNGSTFKFHIKKNYFDLIIKWNKSEESEYPFYAQFNGHKRQIRINDFPDHQLYTLIIDEESIGNFDDWPVK